MMRIGQNGTCEIFEEEALRKCECALVFSRRKQCLLERPAEKWAFHFFDNLVGSAKVLRKSHIFFVDTATKRSMCIVVPENR